MTLSTGFGSTSALDNRIVVGNSLAVGSMVFWAAGFPAADALLQIWHPVTLILLRLITVLCLLYPLWIWMEGRGTLQNVAWTRGFVIGFFGFGIGTALLLFAQWYTDPVTVALIATTTPIMATLLEVWQGDRKISIQFLIGLIASVIGGVFAVGDTFTLDTGIGLFMAIFAGAFFVWASDASVKQLPSLSTLGRTTVTFTGAALFAAVLFIFCWYYEIAALPDTVSLTDVSNLAIYAIAAMAISQIMFLGAVSKIGIALTSLHVNIAPFNVMIFVVLLGGAWNVQVAFGAAIVAIGVILAQKNNPA
jgi:drug/metabolite transporter (DMT)-like permease